MNRARLALVVLSIGLMVRRAGADDLGAPPVDLVDGHRLNFDFEVGSYADWTASGTGFREAIEGDQVHRRRADMRSDHQGRYWASSFEGVGDGATGTLTSRPFRVTRPFARFLLGAGFYPETRIEIARRDTGEVVYRTSADEVAPGQGDEGMRPFVADLSGQMGQVVFLRLVDEHRGPWGHVNFDDFRLHATRPVVAERPQPKRDQYAHGGLAPEAAARAMTAPPGFEVTLFAGEPDVVQPIALALDHRGRLWVAEAYTYPKRAPEGQGRDRILIFEDTDNDGKFDLRKVFADKLNLVSGLEVGFGGVYVGAAPDLLFIPDKNGDDLPDAPPVVLLDGWGHQDTHETLNSFAWGPDGWLYGSQGVFTHSRIGKPGTPDAERTPINAGIWRYHPTKHRFEVWAHGTSNSWGFDWDEHGQMIEEACVIPHLYHMVQGGIYERQAGPHFNPYAYDDIKTIADHRHYSGDRGPHAANGSSSAAGGGHAHSGMLIYQGEAWPAEYHGSLLMNNIHGARLNRDLLSKKGSGFVGSHAPDFLFANDAWSQIVSLKAGPDGSVYMIDWYDKNQCHRTEQNAHDRTNGRIFKVRFGDKAVAAFPVGPVSASGIARRNEWQSRHSRRLVQEQGFVRENVETHHKKPPLDQREASVQTGLNPDDPREVAASILFDEFSLPEQVGGIGIGGPKPNPTRLMRAPETMQLRALWAMHLGGGLRAGEIPRCLDHDDPYVRAWTIQLTMEDKNPSDATRTKFAEMARSDPSPVVRLYLAAALQRMPLEQRWDILEGLSSHAEDAGDPNLPLMVWYALEPMATLDASRALGLAAGSKLPIHLPFMVRRVAAIGTDQALSLLVDELGKVDGPPRRQAFLDGLALALKGRRQVAMPAGWPAVFAKLVRDPDGAVRSRATTLGLTFGDAAALAALREVLVDPHANSSAREESLAALLKARDPALAGPLRDQLATDSPLRGAALRALAAYDDPATPAAILQTYAKLNPGEQRDALNTLAARVAFARPLIAAVEARSVPRADLTADLVRQLRNLHDAGLDAEIGRVWGVARETTADTARKIADYKKMLTSRTNQPPDVLLGRAVFGRTCQQCHKLFGLGGDVGPELTGSNRADLDYLLSNVLDPNALIGKDYTAQVVATADGRVLTGIVRAEDQDAITLITANEVLTVPIQDIEDRKPSDQSMMPQDIWNPLSEHEVRSLVLYLASPAQVPKLATPETAATLFNGRDLAGWVGDPTLWSVQDGEIVGKSNGLAKNEFLRSDLAAGDFQLSFQIKLVDDRGNSGLQFRGESLPDGEMRGDQADVGPGGWGKLHEENGRGLLWDRSGEAFVKQGDWNTCEVVAAGPKIQTSINGHRCVDLDDPTGRRTGVFGFQLHSGGPTEVRIRAVHLTVP